MTRILGMLAVLAAGVALTGAAHATPSYVQFSFAADGAGSATSATYAAGQDILFQQVFAGYTLNITAASSNVYGPSTMGTNPFLSFAIQVSNVGANPPAMPIRIGMTVTGLAAPATAQVGFNSSFTGIFQTASSANFQSYLDPGNAAFGQTIKLSQFDGVSRQSNSYDETVLKSVATGYSMSIFATLTPTAYAHPTLDGQLTANPAAVPDAPAPEPASGALVLVGLAGLMAARKRRGARR